MSTSAPQAIFLSYARDDAAAARRIAEALRSSGLDVWFDENELRGGDKWDAKIRQQINDCALFMPLVSQHTEAREKGYFRLEWKLAVEQTHLLAEGVPFIAPVAIDDTRENGAVVPPEFLRVQWTRLPGALPTPQFVEQTKRLLHAPHKTGGAARSTATGSAAPAPRAPGFPLWAIGAIVVLAITVAYFALRPASKTTTAVPPPTAENTIAPVSEARQLVAKARALYEPWDFATREDYALAENLLKKATDLDPTDGEAWAAYSIMLLGLANNYNVGNDNYDLALKLAERAIKFVPDSGAARFALGYSLRSNPKTLDESIRLLRDEATRQSTNKLVVRTLGAVLYSAGQFEQSLVYLDKAARLPGGDPTAHFLRARTYKEMGRFAEAEAAADEALALAPAYPKAHSAKLWLLLSYHGDVTRARAHLATVPPSYLTDERGAATAGLIWLYAREVPKCVDALRYASDYSSAAISFGSFRGPKAYLTGLAQHSVGNVAVARTEWRVALQVVEKLLDTKPNEREFLGWKAVLLAALGERDKAELLLSELTQRINTGDRDIPNLVIAKILVLLNRPVEAIGSLESPINANTLGSSDLAVRIQLRFDPVWDPLRGNPRLEALLKAPEQKK